MLETAKANLSALLQSATDPETIKILTDSLSDLDKALEEGKRKDTLIDRQAGDLKRLYLNDTPRTPNKPDEPNPAPSVPRVPRTLDQIIEEVTKGN